MTAHSSAALIDTCTCLAVRRTARAVAQMYNALLAPCGLTNAQFTLLAQIKLKQRTTVSDLARRLLIERTTLTRNFDLMEQRGLIDFHENSADRRQRFVALSDGGEAALHAAFPLWAEAQDRLQNIIGAQRWTEVLDAIRRLMKGLLPMPDGARTRATVAESPSQAGASSSPPQPDPQLAYLRSHVCMSTTLRRCSRGISRYYDLSLRPLGLQISQLHVLAAIDAFPGTRLGELATLLTLEQSTLTRLLQRMLGLGQAQKIGSGASKGGFILTDDGRTLLQRGLAGWQAPQRQAANFTGPHHELGLNRLMASMLASIR